MPKKPKAIFDILFRLHYYLHDSIPPEAFNEELKKCETDINALFSSWLPKKKSGWWKHQIFPNEMEGFNSCLREIEEKRNELEK